MTRFYDLSSRRLRMMTPSACVWAMIGALGFAAHSSASPMVPGGDGMGAMMPSDPSMQQPMQAQNSNLLGDPGAADLANPMTAPPPMGPAGNAGFDTSMAGGGNPFVSANDHDMSQGPFDDDDDDDDDDHDNDVGTAAGDPMFGPGQALNGDGFAQQTMDPSLGQVPGNAASANEGGLSNLMPADPMMGNGGSSDIHAMPNTPMVGASDPAASAVDAAAPGAPTPKGL